MAVDGTWIKPPAIRADCAWCRSISTACGRCFPVAQDIEAEVFEFRKACMFSYSAFAILSSRTQPRVAVKRDYPDSDQEQRKDSVPGGHGQAKKAPDDFVT